VSFRLYTEGRHLFVIRIVKSDWKFGLRKIFFPAIDKIFFQSWSQVAPPVGDISGNFDNNVFLQCISAYSCCLLFDAIIQHVCIFDKEVSYIEYEP